MKEQMKVPPSPALIAKCDLQSWYKHFDEIIRDSNTSMYLGSALQNPIKYIHPFTNLLCFNNEYRWLMLKVYKNIDKGMVVT